MYKLYIANKNYSSWSLRPWLALTELDIPFTEVLEHFEDHGSFNKFRDFSPTGQVPCLVDGERTVWESLAIIEYIAETHPQLWPADVDARAWARSAAAEMHAGFSHLRNECPMTIGLRIVLHEISGGLTANIKRLDELWSDGLNRFGGPFLAGATFSAVDAFYAPVAFRIQTYGLPVTATITGYAAHLLQLDGMQAWQTAALAETWREAPHEEEIKAIGTWVEDLRQT
ncbi:MAG: glutathione S-transferase family protein [Pseudomonadota bacterium]